MDEATLEVKSVGRCTAHKSVSQSNNEGDLKELVLSFHLRALSPEELHLLSPQLRLRSDEPY
jgi:hypothetical protein